MSDVVKKVLERRASLVKQMRDVAERAVEEARDMSAEEDAQFTAMNAEVDALQKRADAMLEGEQRAKDTEEAFAKLSGKPQTRQTGPTDEHSAEFRAFATGAPGAARYFEVQPDVQVRDLLKGTASAGGNTVPTSFYGRLVEHMIETAAILRAGATVLNTSGGENLQIPKTTAHSSATLTAEAAALTESDPAFGLTTLGAYKYGLMIQAARELVQDSGVDLEGYLARQAGRALGNGFGAHAITGTGTAQPWGVVTRSTLGVTGGTGVSGAFTGDNLIDLFYSVIEAYRNSSGCAWLMKDVTVGAARKLKGTDGQYLWQPGLQAGAPDLLLGKPVVTDPNVAAVAVNGKSVIFGDIGQYFVRLAGGIRFERSDDFAFNTDLVSFRAILRADGDLVDQTGAVKHYVGAAT